MTQPGRPEITVPSLLLTTTGRKSGEKYVFPLFYGTSGDGYFVDRVQGRCAATPWLVPQHPRRSGGRGAGRHDEAAGAGTHRHRRTERTRLWEKSLEFWPPYADYQRKTEREIPIVVLDPVK